MRVTQNTNSGSGLSLCEKEEPDDIENGFNLEKKRECRNNYFYTLPLHFLIPECLSVSKSVKFYFKY